MDTQRMKSAFPIVARVRKGEKKGPKNIGKDLNDRFRFDFYPGTEVVQAAFYKRYETFQPHEFRALIPDLTPFNGAWTWFNQAFLTRQVACANDQRYLWLIDPETGKYIVRDGEPFRPFIPKDEIPFKTASGKDILLKMKSVMFLHLLLHEVQGHFVTFELYSTSFYDRLRVEAQLRAIQGIANIITGGNVGAIPLLVRRSPQEVTWTQGRSGTRTEKWLIDIGPDPVWAERVGFPKLREILGDDVAATMLNASDRSPVQGDLNPDDEVEELEETVVPETTHPMAAAGTGITLDPQTLAEITPKSPTDYTTFWGQAVPRLGATKKQALDAVEAGKGAQEAFALLLKVTGIQQ
jgi:hypothetical protein